MRSLLSILAILSFLAPSSLFPGVPPDTCESVVRDLNRNLQARIDEEELVQALRSLNASEDRKLPEKFVTKGKARRMGWSPGRDLWGVAGLQGKSIGGDRFGNRERRLPRVPEGWREADLDYKGGRRGAKRLVYSPGGRRMITVDHYSSFLEVPACR
ncbi:MAG: barnase family single strand ribonuclease [Deltaproteobacteria bacterium]|nr:barnase family single strand ribonuclease [Deltaproteobacteria bacterium]